MKNRRKYFFLAKVNIFLHRIILLAVKRKGYHYYQIGCSLEYINNFKKAIMFLEKAISYDFQNSDLFFRLGFSYKQIGEKKIAINNYSIALKLSPDNYSIYFNRASLYEETNEIDLAEKDFLESIKNNPNYAKSFVGLGVIYYYHKKNIDNAIKYYRKGIELEPIYKEYLPRELAGKL